MLRSSISRRVEAVNSRPGAVRTTLRVDLKNSDTPSCLSSWRTSRLTADWVIPRSAAAAVKLPYSATELAARICLIETSNPRALGVLAITHSKSLLTEAIGKELTYIGERSNILSVYCCVDPSRGGICDCRSARFK